MRVAAHAELASAETTLARFGERAAIVVTRYDRSPDGKRLHQEDFCQALALDPQAKYEAPVEAERHGSRLGRLVDIAAPRSVDPDLFRRELLSLVTFNIVIGNGDAHSKNYSILLGPRGEVTLAPLYDAAPVMFLSPRFKNTGHVINGRTNIDWVSLDDLASEAVGWGMGRARAASTIDEVVSRTWDAVHALPLPEGAEQVLPRLEDLWARRSWH
jgi:serine/threonine-protein kinase HipA